MFSILNSGEGPPANYTRKTFGQAVNSLDRVERVDNRYRRRKKHSQINEVFSFIDKERVSLTYDYLI